MRCDQTNWRTILIRSIFVQYNAIKCISSQKHVMLVGMIAIKINKQWVLGIRCIRNERVRVQILSQTFSGVVITIICHWHRSFSLECAKMSEKRTKICDKLHVICQSECMQTKCVAWPINGWAMHHRTNASCLMYMLVWLGKFNAKRAKFSAVKF